MLLFTGVVSRPKPGRSRGAREGRPFDGLLDRASGRARTAKRRLFSVGPRQSLSVASSSFSRARPLPGVASSGSRDSRSRRAPLRARLSLVRRSRDRREEGLRVRPFRPGTLAGRRRRPRAGSLLAPAVATAQRGCPGGIHSTAVANAHASSSSTRRARPDDAGESSGLPVRGRRGGAHDLDRSVRPRASHAPCGPLRHSSLVGAGTDRDRRRASTPCPRDPEYPLRRLPPLRRGRAPQLLGGIQSAARRQAAELVAPCRLPR